MYDTKSEKRLPINSAFRKYIKSKGTDERGLLGCLNAYKDEWRKHRETEYDKKWRENIAFYSGNHYVRDPSINRTNSYRVLAKENHVNNQMNRMISVFVQNMPVPRLFPVSDGWRDVQDAERTESYGKYFWRTGKLEQKMAKFVKYSAIMGNGFIYTNWDADAVGRIRLDEEDTDDGKTVVRKWHGDVSVKIDDPFKIFVRPGIDEFDDHYDIIRAEPVNKYEIESKYGPIEAEAAVAQNAYTNELRQDDDIVMIYHYWHKPCSWFEEGLYACFTEKKVLKAVEWPFSSQAVPRLPFAHLPFDKSPLRFWGQASIEQVIDLQEQLNRAASQIIEARNLVARPRVLAAHQSKIPSQSLTDRPGEIVRYDAAGPAPQFYVPPFNFAEMQAHKSDLRNAMSMVMGMSAASRGEIPQGARTALALQLVLEQDRSQFLPFIKSFHQSIIDMMTNVFELSSQYIDEEDPRNIKIEGPHGGEFVFDGSMVPSPLDVYLEDTNPLGWTATGRIEGALELVKAGLITDKNQALQMIKINSPDPAFDIIQINRKTQQREFEALNKGEVVTIGPEDDDNIHIEELVKVMASYEFKSRPEPVRLAYEAHVRMHKERIAEFMQGQQGAPVPQQGGAIKSGGIDPATMGAMGAPVPGGNIEKLLNS